MELSDFLNEWDSAAPYVEAKTSGSTGQPKSIRLLKADMEASARATNKFFNIGRNSLLGIPLGFDYIAAKMMAVRARVAGCELAVLPVSNAFEIDEEITLLSVVPSQAQCLVEHPQWSSLVHNVLIGGGPLDPALEQRLIYAGYQGYCSYGMTETCSHVALRALGENLYLAMPGISFAIDQRGCLVIEAPAFSFGRLVTNDVVELADANAFRWLGRADNVIISGGIKIHAEEVEALYGQYLKGRFYVKGVPDIKWGHALALVIEKGEDSIEEIRERLGHNVDHKLLPKSIEVVDRLQMADNGKIRRI